MFRRNSIDQVWRVYAYNRQTNEPYLGGAATLTAKIELDNAGPNPTASLHPVEKEDGFYNFPLTQPETNADRLDLYPESSTSDIVVIGVPGTIFTSPEVTETVVPPATSIDILAAANAPLRTRTEEGTVQERSITELIAAAQYLNPPPDTVPWGIRVAKVRYGSTTS